MFHIRLFKKRDSGGQTIRHTLLPSQTKEVELGGEVSLSPRLLTPATAASVCLESKALQGHWGTWSPVHPASAQEHRDLGRSFVVETVAAVKKAWKQVTWGLTMTGKLHCEGSQGVSLTFMPPPAICYSVDLGFHLLERHPAPVMVSCLWNVHHPCAFIWELMTKIQVFVSNGLTSAGINSSFTHGLLLLIFT